MNLLSQFKEYLFSQDNRASKLTVKNYLSDIRHFISWFENEYKQTFSPAAVTDKTINLYKEANKELLSASSIQRHLSSLRKFFTFLKLESQISINPFEQMTASAEALAKEDPWRLKDFKSHLYVYNASHLTIKNYVIDVKQFIRWAKEVTASTSNVAGANAADALADDLISTGKVNKALIEEYKARLVNTAGYSPATINRKLSSLRRYLKWAEAEGILTQSLSSVENIIQAKQPVFIPQIQIKPEKEIGEAPPKRGFFTAPIRIGSAIGKLALIGIDLLAIAHLVKIANKAKYIYWKLSGQPVFVKGPQSVVAKTITADDILGIKNISKAIYAPFDISTKNFSLLQKIIFHARFTRPKWYKAYHSYSVTHYFHFAILIIFLSAVAFGIYSSFFQAGKPALAVLPTAPPRILSFQGRLTDSFDNPITSLTDLRFAIYNNVTASGAALLWQEVNEVSPDQDGIFNVILGSTTAIDQSVFGENSALWLGVTVEATGELTPRQRIATVAYAANAETLQGLLPITGVGAGTTNVVLALDSSGNLTIGGSANPTFAASGGQFKLSGQPLILTTNAGSDANVQITTDDLGKIDLQKPILNSTNSNNITTAIGAVEVNDLFAVLATSSGQSAVTINQTSTGPILSASASGSERFTVANDGDITTAGNIITASSLSTFTTSATLSLTATALNLGGGNAATISTVSDDNLTLTAQGTGHLRLLSDADTDILLPYSDFTSEDNSVLYTGAGGKLSAVTTTSSGLCLTSNGTDAPPSWGSCTASGGTNWDVINGVITPKLTSTLDFLLGSTASNAAKFAVLNVNSGTPVASVSSGLSGTSMYMTADGTLATQNRMSLTIGNSSTYNTTGNVLINPNGTGNVGIGTTDPLGKLHVNNSSDGTLFRMQRAGGTNLPIFQFNFTESTNIIEQEITGASAPTLTWKLGGSEKMRITPSGMLGIGNTTPLTALDVTGSASISANLGFRGAATAHTFNILDNGTLNIQRSPGGDAGLATALFIQNNGNVGIGTITPESGSDIKLDVIAGVKATEFVMFDSGVFGGSVGYDTSNDELVLKAGGNSVKMTVEGTGNVGIGTTGPGGNLEIASSDTLTRPALRIRASTGQAYGFDFDHEQVTTGYLALYSVDNDVRTLGLVQSRYGSSTGFVGIGTTAPTAKLDITGSASISANLGFRGAATAHTLNIFDNGTLNIQRSPGGDAGLTSVVYISNNGNVGLGTSTFNGSTNNQLRVIGNAEFGNATGIGAAPVAGQYLTLGSTANNLVIPAGTTSSINLTSTAGTAVGGILFGTDTTLYRSAADTLKTDDRLAVGTLNSSASNVLCYDSGNILSTCTSALGTNYWQLNSGALSPFSNTLDLLVGSTATTSAKFAVLNVNSGTPVASVSSGLSGTSMYMTADGTLATQNRMSLTIGNSSTYNTTGNVLINPNGTGNVGIGTTGPAAKLDVQGLDNSVLISGRRTGGNVVASINTDGSGHGLFYVNDNSGAAKIQLSAQGTSGTTYFNSGSVGIGTTTPTALLDVAGSASLSANLSLRGAATAHTMNILDNGTLNIQRSPGGDAGLTTALFIQNNGNVGIGTASPDTKLHTEFADGVWGVKFGNATKNLQFSSDQLVSTGGPLYLNASTNNNVYLVTGGGNVGIGTASPISELHVTRPLSFGATGKALAIFDQIENQDIFTASKSGVAKFTVTSAGGIKLGTSEGSANDCLLSGGAGAAASFGSCAGAAASAIYWNQGSGALYPKNSTVDLLVGGQATTSAKFAVLNVNSGTPVASVSSGLSGTSAYLTADGTLATQNRMSLTIGNSATYNTTGNVLINPNGTGNVGIGTTDPQYKLSVSGGQIAGSRTGNWGGNVYDVADLVLGSDGETRNGYGGTNGSNIMLRSSDKSSITALDQSNNLGQISYQNLKWTIGEDIGWGAQTVYIPGNVGIGTTTPTTTLDITGSASISANLGFRGAATAHTMNILDNGTLNIQRSPGGDAGLATALFVQNNGNVGIGTTSPGALLQVGGSTATVQTNVRLMIGTGAQISGIQLDSYSDNNKQATILNDNGSVTFTSPAYLTLKSANNYYGDITLNANNNGGILLLNGNVGIADTSPDAKLEVLSTTEQLRLTHTDGTIDARFTLDGNGDLAIDASTDGTGSETLTLTGFSTLTASSLATVTTAATLGMASTTTLNLGTSATINAGATALNLQADGTPDVNIAGGSGTTGCTIANATGNLTCSGTISGSGATGYWNRSVGNIFPATTNDTISATTSASVALTLTQTGAFNSLLVQDEASDTTPFVIDQSGNVGIGTTSPTEKLRVVSADNTTATNIAGFLANNLSQGVGIGFNAIRQLGTNANLTVDANGTGYLLLQTVGTGNVGIGTTAPDARLEINHATGDNMRLTYNDSDGSATNYTDFSLSSSGDLTIAPSGGEVNLNNSRLYNGVIVPLYNYNGGPTVVGHFENDFLFAASRYTVTPSESVDAGTIANMFDAQNRSAASWTNATTTYPLTITIDRGGAGDRFYAFGIEFIYSCYAGSVKIEVSTDGAAWTTLIDKTGNTDDFVFVKTSASWDSVRHIRYTLANPNTGCGTDLIVAELMGWSTIPTTQFVAGPGLYVGGGTMYGNIGLNSNIITDIGNTGTDFDTSGGLTLAGDLAVNGADITTTSTGTATVFNTNATTINFGGAATRMNFLAAGDSVALFGALGSGSTVAPRGIHISNGEPLLVLERSTAGADVKKWQIGVREGDTTNFTISSILDNNTVSVDALSITRAGNVGIGTTSPTAKLDVAGTASVGGQLKFRSGTAQIQSTVNQTLTLGGDTTGNIIISPNNGLNANGARLDVNAKSAFGTDTASVPNADRAITLQQNFQNTSTNAYGIWSYAYEYDTTNTAAITGVYGQGGYYIESGTKTLAWARGVAGLVDVAAPAAGTNTITNAAALFAHANTDTGAGVITNGYGLYVEDQTVGATSDVGIYVAGADTYAIQVAADDVVFMDDLWVGATSESITDTGFAPNNDDVYIEGDLGINGITYLDGNIDTLFTGNNAVLYGTVTTGVVASATTSTAGQCLTSGAGAGYTPTWASCTSGGDPYWNQQNGTLFPNNSTVDLLVGAQATTSAKFAVLNVNGTATPIASVSATSGSDATKGVYLSGNGSIQSVRNNTLTIGGSTTGEISLAENTLIGGNLTLNGYVNSTLTPNGNDNYNLGDGSNQWGTVFTGALESSGSSINISDQLVFSGITTDITTGSNQDLVISPNGTGNVGIGDTGPDAKFEILGTTEQLRLTHTDGTVDTRFTVESDGDFLINASADGTGNETLTLTGFASLLPGADNTMSLGSSPSARFKDLFLGPGSLHIICTTGDGCGAGGLDYALGVNTSTGTFSIGVNGATATGNPLLNITQGGNVGIGTTAPSGALDVRGGSGATGVQSYFSAYTGYAAPVAATSGFGGGAKLVLWDNGTTARNAIGMDGSANMWFSVAGTQAPGFAFYTMGDGTTIPTAKLTIQNGGNVGIGDTSPDAKLEVLGTTEQLRLTYTDGTIDSRFTLDSSGNLTIDASSDGTGSETLTLTGFNTLTASSLTTLTTSATLGMASTTTLNLGTDATLSSAGTALNIEENGGVDVNIAGTSASTGCTVTNSNGNLACAGTITAGGTALTQYWQRNAGNLSPLTTNDTLSATSAASTVATFTTNNPAGTLTQNTLIQNTGAGTVTSLLQLTRTAGTVTNGINFTGAMTQELNLQNGETISNSTDNQINLGLGTSGVLLLTSTTDSDIANSAGPLTLDAVTYTRVGTGTTPGSATGADDLHVASDLEVDGVIFAEGTIDTLFTGNNAVLYGTVTTGVVASATTSTAGQCLTSGVGAGYTPTWASCTSGGDPYWNQQNGTLFPNNSTVDLLIGGQATTSARFHAYGNPAFAGTTASASISGTTSFATFVIDQSGIGDIFTASKSGATKLRLDNRGFLGINVPGTQTIESLLELQGGEGMDAALTLDADEGDDAADTWFIKSEATGNDLSIVNDTTEVFNLTTAGDLQIDGDLTVSGNLITFGNGEAIDNNSDNQINLNLGTSGVLLLTSTTDSDIANSAGPLTLDAVTYTRIGTGTTPGSATGADDLHVASDLEVDGVIYAHGNSIQSSTLEALSLSADDVSVVGCLNVGSATECTTQGNAQLAGDLTVTGNLITFGNAETIDNNVDGTIQLTATTLGLSGTTITASSLTTLTTSATLGMASTTTLNLGTNATLSSAGTALNIEENGGVDVNIAGTSASTGCTVTNSNGNLACAGTITAGGTALTQYWQRSAGNLSPVNTNDTLSATTSAGVALTLTQTGAFNALLVQDEASDTTPFVIDQDGDVGIETSSPQTELSFGTDGATIGMDTSDGSDTKSLKITGGGAGAFSRGAQIVLYGNENASTGILSLQAGNVSGGEIQFLTGGGQKAVLTNGGNLGINDTSPDAKLEVLGTSEQLRLTYTDGTIDARFTVDASGNLAIDASSDGTGSETLTLTGFNTLTASSLTTLTTSATVDWGTLTALTFTGDNLVLSGSDAASGNLTLQGTTSSTRTTSYLLLQPNGGLTGIGLSTPISQLHVTRPLSYGATGKALAIFDQIENQDILTASKSGTTQFRVTSGGSVYARSFFDLDAPDYFIDPSAAGTGLNMTGTTITASNLTTFTTAATLAFSGNLTEAGSAVLSAADIDTCAEFIALVASTGTCGSTVFSVSPAITTSLTTPSTTFALVNTTATTVNFAGAATTLTMGASTGTATIANAALTLSNATTLTASSLATFTTSAAVSWGTLTALTFTGDNLVLSGSDAANGNLSLQGTTSSTRTTSYLLLQPNGGLTGIGLSTPISQLHVTRPLSYGATGKALAIFDQIESQDIFTASASGTRVFYINNSGDTYMAGSVVVGNETSGTNNWMFGQNAEMPGSRDCNGAAGVAALCIDNDDGDDGEASLGQSGIWTTAGAQNASSNPDFAEYVNIEDISIESGDIVSSVNYDPNASDKYSKAIASKSTNSYQISMIGAISEDAAFMVISDMSNSAVSPSNNWLLENERALTVAGRIPVKVSTINGEVRVGDAITSSEIPGIGMKATRAGKTLGTALTDFEDSASTQSAKLVNGEWETRNYVCAEGEAECYNYQKVLVFISPSWHDPDVYLTDAGNLSIVPSVQDIASGFEIRNTDTNELVDRVGAFSELVSAKIRIGSAQIKNLTVDSLTITGENILIGEQTIREYIASVIYDLGFTINELASQGDALRSYGQIISPLAEIDTLHTNLISPLSKNPGIAVKLEDNKLSILNGPSASSEAVISFDNAGNASFSGSLTANNLTIEQLNNSGNATIGGTLRASRIIADSIEGLNVNAATVSANYITNNYYTASSDQGLASSFPTLAASPASDAASLSTIPYTLNANNFVNIATFSSQLAYVENLYGGQATFASGLTVYGQTILSDTSVIGQLAIGGNMILEGNSVNVLGSDLNLQPLRQGGISLMAGLIYIDTNGNVTFEKDTTVKGTLFANTISPIPGKDLTIKLASSDQGLAVSNSSNSAILSIDSLGNLVASGAANIAKLNINSIVAPALAVSQTEEIATGSAGVSQINAYKKEMTINNPLVTEKSLIYITPTSNTDNQVLYLFRQVPGESFTVGIQNPTLIDIPFNWIIIN